MAESQVKKDCLNLCKQHPKVARAWRQNAGKIRAGQWWITLAPAGTPDIIGYLRGGRFLGIEVKDPDARPRKDQDHQITWAAEATRDGALILRVSSVEALAEALNAIGEI